MFSSDFRHHPVAAQLARVIELHDRSRFEVIGVSTGPDDASPQRRRLMAAFDRFEDVRGRSAAEVARRLRDLEVDVLVDLNGHTEGDSFDVLAYRPARVQASWLGYAGTTAAPFVDYLIADAVVAPHDDAFSERLVRLPHSFFPADDKPRHRPMPGSRRNRDCRRTVLSSAASTTTGNSPPRCFRSGCGCSRRYPEACCG